MSHAKLSAHSLNSTVKSLLKRSAHLGLGLSAFAPVLALANPTGGTVMAGTATITNPNANGTVVKETSAAAIIDWQQFNIGKGQYVQFLQPSSSSIILNRVTGGGGSSIYGSLTGNGQIFLVNTNGVFFGKGSSIDAQGFLASTLDISDSDFLARNFVFDKSGNDATVINQGSITAHKGGYVVLAGDYTENDGIIAAQSGHIILASGTKSTLTLNGNSLVSFAVNQATLAQLAGVDNAGKLEADGGTVIMTADVANLLKATVVNNTGLIEATSLSNQGGVIQLLATGGNISNAGTLDVAATRAGQQGGSITLKGDAKTILTDTSKITATGDGANGGHVEVSGETLSMRGSMTLGKGGRLLLDPASVELMSGSTNSPGVASNNTSAGKIGVKFIEKTLNSGAAVDIQATNKIDASANVKTITATGTGELSLQANKIALSGVDITIGGKLAATMSQGTFGHLTAASIDLHAAGSNARIVLPGATVTKGVVSTWSAKATAGNLSIAAGSLVMQNSSAASATLALSAKQQLTVAATYGTGGTERAGNLILAGSRIDAMASEHVTGNITATASNGYAEFGNIAAGGNIQMNAAGTFLEVHDLAAGGSINLTNTGRLLYVTDLSAGGNVTLTDSAASGQTRADHIQTGGKLTINAAKSGIQFGSPSVAGGSYTLKAAKGIAITAEHMTFSGTNNAVFRLAGGTGDITVHGAIGSSGTPSLAIGKGGVSMVTTGNVSLDHRINVNGTVDIQAKSLAYTGTGPLEIDAHGGGIIMDASIGTAKAPVAYDVQLDADSGLIDIQRSIYTKGSIGVAESHQTIGLGAGVHVGNGDSTSITLSAKGPISLKGAQVDIGADHGSGHDAPITISADDGNSKTSTDNLTITASDGSVYIQPSGNAINNGAVAKASLNHTITLHAGNDVDISAVTQVSIRGAGGSNSPSSYGMRAFGQGANTSVSAIGGVDVTAGHDIKVSGFGVDVRAGFVRANAASDSKSKLTATASADVVFTAGNDIDITGAGGGITIGGGAVYGYADASNKSQMATAKASATATLTAGHNVTITDATGAVNITAGDRAGTGSGAFASASNAAANVTLDNNVGIQAGNALAIKGVAVTLRGGNDAGGAFVGYPSPSASISRVNETRVIAAEKGTTATIAVDSALNLSAGKGGMSLSGSLSVDGGRNAAQALQMYGSGSAAHVSDTIDASVTLASKGNLTFKGSKLEMQAGSAARVGLSTSRTSGGIVATRTTQISGRGDAVMALNVDTGVTLNAAGSITATEANSVLVDGGNREASDMQVNIGALGAKGTTNISLDGGVGITAGTTLSLTGNLVNVQAGVDAASGAHVQAYGGAVTWSVDDAVALSAKSVALTSTSTGVHAGMDLRAGNGGEEMTMDVGNAAKANVSLDQALTITATNGGITLKGHSLNARGGSSGGFEAGLSASNGATATLDQNAALNFKATGAFLASFAGNNLSIHGGSNGLEAAHATAKAGGAVASLSAEDSISITAASAKLIGANVSVAAGRGATPIAESFSIGSATIVAFMPPGVAADADGKATATVKESGALNLTVTGLLSISGSRDVVLRGANSNGYGGTAFAQGVHAVSNFSADGSLNIKAGSMQVSAGQNLTVGDQERDGLHASAEGRQGGNATYLENSSVNVTVAKALTLNASNQLVIGGDQRIGGATVSAHSSAAAALTTNDGVNLKAGSVALSAVNGIAIGGGSEIGEGTASAGGKSKAAYTADAGVTITAATGFSAKLTGSDSNASIKLAGAKNTGNGASADGFAGGTAMVNVAAGLSINVTGATGSVDIDTGKTIHGALTIMGGVGAGDEARTVGDSGAASMNVAAGVSIAAKGAVTLTGNSAGVLVGAGSGVGGGSRSDRAETRATGTGGKAATSLSNAVSVSGGTLSLTDNGGDLAIQGGYRVHIASPSFTGIAAAGYYSDQATGPKVTATTTVNSSVSLTAKGNLSLTAQTVQLGVSASNADLASGAKVAGIFGGKAALTANTGVALVGGNVSIQATTLDVSGQKDVARDADLLGGSNGGNASLTANGGVSIKASGTLTLTAANSIELVGGTEAGLDASVDAFATGAKAALSAQSAVSLSAKTVNITAGGFFGVTGGAFAAEGLRMSASSGGAATATVASQVSINATGTLSVSAHGAAVQAGQSGAVLADLVADHGKASLAVTSGAAITAGGNLSMNLNSHGLTLFAAGASGGQTLTAGPSGTVSEQLDQSLLLKSGGKLSLIDVGNLGAFAGFFAVAPTVTTTGNGKVSGQFIGTLTLQGKSLSTSGITTLSDGSGGGFTGNPITVKTGIVVTPGGISKLSFAPLSLGTLQTDGLILNLETVLEAPAQGGESTLFTPATGTQAGANGCSATLVKQDGRCFLQY